MTLANSIFTGDQLRAAETPKKRRAASNRAWAAFENLIEASQVDEQGPVVSLVKIGNFAKRVFKDGKLEIVEQRSPFDFAGTVWRMGRAIFFDAKHVGDQHASLEVNQPHIVRSHQIIALERLSTAGAIAGLLVECCRHRDFRWLPATRLRSDKPIRWDAGVWIVLGPSSGKVPFRKLVQVYGGV